MPCGQISGDDSFVEEHLFAKVKKESCKTVNSFGVAVARTSVRVAIRIPGLRSVATNCHRQTSGADADPELCNSTHLRVTAGGFSAWNWNQTSAKEALCMCLAVSKFPFYVFLRSLPGRLRVVAFLGASGI